MNDADPTYTLEELARQTGVSPRTIRYYVQRGVLPPPVFRGPHTGYDSRYVDWLHYIAAHQAAGWTLDQIAIGLADLDPRTGRARGFRTLESRDLQKPQPGQLDSKPVTRQTSTPIAAHPDRAESNVNSTPNPPASVRVQPAAEVWIRVPIADGIDMWLRHETDAQQRLLQDVVLAAAQKAAPAARKETP